MYNLSRAEIEARGRSAAGVINETESTQLVRVLDAFDLRVLKDDASLTPCLVRDGFWESWITSWLTKWLRPGHCFVDIGANCGYYTLLAEKLVGKYGNVAAYEPNPVYAELLRQTRDTNNSTYKIREVALADYKGSTSLSVPGNYHGSASIVHQFKNPYTPTEYDVRVTTLDAEVRNLSFFKHDFVKMDAEGAEQMIWNGGRSLWFDDSSHTTLMIEYTPQAYTEGFLEELFDWGIVSRITEDGGECPVTLDWVESLVDWQMLIVRKR